MLQKKNLLQKKKKKKITKEKISSKKFTKTVTWKLVPSPFAFAKNET